jgi:hypothetical protein
MLMMPLLQPLAAFHTAGSSYKLHIILFTHHVVLWDALSEAHHTVSVAAAAAITNTLLAADNI